MPIGGVKEKVLAARRAGIHELILPSENEKDLVEIQEELRIDLTFHFVDDIDEVFDLALIQE